MNQTQTQHIKHLLNVLYRCRLAAGGCSSCKWASGTGINRADRCMDKEASKFDLFPCADKVCSGWTRANPKGD